MWNKSFLCFLLCLTLGSCGNRSEKTAVVSGYAVSKDSVSVAINGNVPVSGVWDAGWLHRYAADVEELAAKAAADQRKDIDVVFFGSSSIRLWNGLEEMMAPLSVVNRGYGGATVRDIHYNYSSIMAHYRPKAFVVFCDNDICGNEVDLTVSGVLDHYRLLFNRLDQDYPGVPVFFLSWKYSGLRAFMRDTQKLVNDVMADYASSSNQVTFVDVNATLLQPDGDINQSLFESDNLHINRDGYLLWTSVLKPLLLEVCEK